MNYTIEKEKKRVIVRDNNGKVLEKTSELLGSGIFLACLDELHETITNIINGMSISDANKVKNGRPDLTSYNEMDLYFSTEYIRIASDSFAPDLEDDNIPIRDFLSLLEQLKKPYYKEALS